MQLNQVTGRDVAQQCGNRALAAAITREKAKPQTGEYASPPAQHQLTQWQWQCQAEAHNQQPGGKSTILPE